MSLLAFLSDFGEATAHVGSGAFRKVVKGMEVVKKIQAAPAEGQSLAPPVMILKGGPTMNAHEETGK